MAISFWERPESVFLSTWHAFEPTRQALTAGAAGATDWDLLFALRKDVARELERLRTAGEIGAPLDAQLTLWCIPELHGRIATLGAELRFFMVTSEAQVHVISPEVAVAVSADVARSPAGVPADAVPALSVPGVWLAVVPSGAAKCVRCWHHRPDVGVDAAHPELCVRCAGNLSMPGETRRHC